MDSFKILNEERRTISKWSCPVDLMGEIGKEANEFVAFKLTAAALMAMFAFPVEKSVVFMPDEGDETIIRVTVIWIPSGEEMRLWTNDGGETFMVEEANTTEIKCKLEDYKSYTCYTIDME